MGLIYKITNKVNGKVYVGKTDISLAFRFEQHCKDSKRFTERPLYRAFNKYGIENFSIELIEETKFSSEREIYWIEILNSYKYGYNATKGGEGRSLVEEEAILNLHFSNKSMREISEILNYDFATVKKILDKHELEPNIHKHRVKTSKKIINKTTNTIYDSQHDAARSLKDDLTVSERSSLANKISLCCRGIRKSVLGNVFEYYNPH